jgi:hypothetical protein
MAGRLVSMVAFVASRVSNPVDQFDSATTQYGGSAEWDVCNWDSLECDSLNFSLLIVCSKKLKKRQSSLVFPFPT